MPIDAKLEMRVLPQALHASRSKSQEAIITGYAALFNVLSENLGGFQERIAPGAFQGNLKGADVRALINHNPNQVLGRTKARTLELLEDRTGLAFSITAPDTQVGRDIVTLLQRGDVNQMSFSFQTIRDEWDTSTDIPIRTLREVRLFDISVVTYPAYTGTSAQVRGQAIRAGNIRNQVSLKAMRFVLDLMEKR